MFLAGFAAASAGAQTSTARTSELRAWRVVPGEFGPVIEVLSTGSLNPQIQVVENPLRLVIDLPGSTVGRLRARIPFRNAQIKGVRLSQYQSAPPVSRVVVDLAAPVLYTWDATGNRLNIRLRADDAARAKPPSVVGLSAGSQSIAVPVSLGTSGTLVETGSRVAAGSSITAGDEIAVLRLTRGGEIRVCPGTTVSVATSATGQDLMLGMSKGAMETHYGVQESVDSVLTPDFRIVLPGPGEFNLAVSADAKGNTCVGSIPGSTSSAVVAELLGSGTYEIKPDQQVLFRGGRLDSVETPVTSCGCPAAPTPIMRADVDSSKVVSEDQAGEQLRLQNSSSPSDKPPATGPDSGSAQASEPDKPVAESALVFSGEEIAKARQRKLQQAKIPPSPTAEAAKLPLGASTQDPLPTVVVLPPAPEPKNKGFFGKIKGFFSKIF